MWFINWHHHTLIEETFARQTFANLTIFREFFSLEKLKITHSRKFVSWNFSYFRFYMLSIIYIKMFLCFLKTVLNYFEKFLHSLIWISFQVSPINVYQTDSKQQQKNTLTLTAFDLEQRMSIRVSSSVPAP